MLLLASASPALAAARPGDVAAYMRARAAEADGAVKLAAGDYADALNQAPGNPVVAMRAYRTALDAGDYALADRALRTLQQAGAAPADAALTTLADAIHDSDRRAASAAIDRLDGTPLAFMAPVLKAWEAFDDGDKNALALLDASKGNPVGEHYAAENRALLQIATGDTTTGIASIRALLGPDRASFDLRIAAAQLLAGQGRRDLALSLLGGDDPVVTGFRQALGNGARPSLAFGADHLLDRLAADLTHDQPNALIVTLTRAAIRIDPHDDRARLLLAQTLAQMDATDLALEAINGVDPAGPFAAIARSARVAVLADAGRDEDALAAAKAAAAAPGAGPADLQQLGDAYVALDRYAEAADAYSRAIGRAGDGADWTMYLQLGGALDEAGQWPAARQALQKAVALGPQQPLALNYLGYADIEHGEDLAAAQEMLVKALALKPGDPAITDSLAWAYFKRGDAAKALPLFERAAQDEPSDETINEHLGDAYWQAGRHVEARYAWRAAAVNAEAADKQRLMAKIDNGLGTGPVDH